ncbi:MAG: DUF2953 domain-containing protein [Clostridia bacterium]|nr:DUF2953 domain-containing protein [Clostridia bacterium]
MLALIIVLCVLLVILTLLLLPIRLSVSYQDDVKASLSFLFLRFPLYPKKEKRIRPRDYSKKKLKKRKRKRQAAASGAAPKKKKTATQSLRTVRLLLHIFKDVYQHFFPAFRIRVCRLNAVVATTDAASTAILYGVVCQSVSYLLEALHRMTGKSVKGDEVTVVADFLGEKTSLSLDILLSTNLLRVLCLALRAATSFLKFHKTEKAKTITEVPRYE